MGRNDYIFELDAEQVRGLRAALDNYSFGDELGVSVESGKTDVYLIKWRTAAEPYIKSPDEDWITARGENIRRIVREELERQQPIGTGLHDSYTKYLSGTNTELPNIDDIIEKLHAQDKLYPLPYLSYATPGWAGTFRKWLWNLFGR